MKKTILLSLLAASQLTLAAESDNFTARLLNVIDVSSDVNNLANDYLAKAVNDINNTPNGCNNAILYKELQKYFANHSKGELVKTILYTDKIQKVALPLKESIYQDWKPMDGFLLGRKSAATSPLALSALIKIGEQDIGVDKLEHMFGMGFQYFTQFHLEGKKISSVLERGIMLEKTILGGNIAATGVFSYGDLAANFNGMRFWNHMLQKEDDVLGSHLNIGPYVTCVDKKWKVNKENPIDFRNYVDASMDESINCSKIAGTKGLRKLKAAIKRRGFVTTDDQAACPIDPSALKEMKHKYRSRNIDHFIINEEGLGKVSYLREFKE
jgi:hypothetical protein